VKRPEGFDHRPAPQPVEPPSKGRGRRTPAESPSTTPAERSSAAPVTPSASSGPATPPVSPPPTRTAAPSVTTDPPAFTAAGRNARRPAEPTGSAPTGSAAPQTADTQTINAGSTDRGTSGATPRAPKPSRTRVRPDKSSATEASAARQDRRKLRKAASARRKFERSEVRRFTKRTRHRRAAWVTIAAIVASLAVVLAVAVYSPILALREITVDGTNRVSTEEVTAALDDQLGTPLALIDFGEIRSELAAFPLIRSYVTETVPPNTLRIHVVEREAIGTVERRGSFEQVDPAGVVVASSSERPAGPLIDVSGTGTDTAVFASAVEVLLTMPQAVLDRIDVISARTADNVRLTLRDTGSTVAWGSADDSELKGQVLARMLERPECAGQVVDVTAPLAPICGPE
jgi:cell division protein FtsQ